MDQLKVRINDVPRVMVKSNCLSYKSVLDAVEMNLINMENPWDTILGKLQLVINTSQMPGGSAQ